MCFRLSRRNKKQTQSDFADFKIEQFSIKFNWKISLLGTVTTSSIFLNKSMHEYSVELDFILKQILLLQQKMSVIFLILPNHKLT
jgi:hypothetical protein